MLHTVPAVRPRSTSVARPFYGWVVVLVAAASMVGTLPARTQGLGLITEPLLRDLGIEHVAYAELNLWATLIGSLGALGIGRALDRFGSRVVLTLVVCLLGATVCAMSRVHSLRALAVCVTLTRGLGQSALSVISIAMVGQWFVRRIDKAMALYSAALSVGFMLAFPLVGTLVERWGWRETWLAVGGTLLLGLAPLGALLVRRDPESCGLEPDGEIGSRALAGARAATRERGGATLAQALLTPAFWVFALGAALYGLVASGIGLFNESILAERGFSAAIYHETLAVTAITALAGNFLGGWLAGRVALARLLALALFALAGGLVALPFVSTHAHVLAWAVAMGLAGGLVMVLFFSVWSRAYGRAELGRIQGTAQAITVLASAVGPLLLAWCAKATGSYATMFVVLAGVVTALGIAALLVRLPTPPGPAPADARLG